MKAISLYVDEPTYLELKALAKARRRPVAELVRDAMGEYVASSRAGDSLLELAPHPSGRLLRAWKRHELVDEMRSR